MSAPRKCRYASVINTRACHFTWSFEAPTDSTVGVAILMKEHGYFGNNPRELNYSEVRPDFEASPCLRPVFERILAKLLLYVTWIVDVAVRRKFLVFVLFCFCSFNEEVENVLVGCTI